MPKKLAEQYPHIGRPEETFTLIKVLTVKSIQRYEYLFKTKNI